MSERKGPLALVAILALAFVCVHYFRPHQPKQQRPLVDRTEEEAPDFAGQRSFLRLRTAKRLTASDAASHYTRRASAPAASSAPSHPTLLSTRALQESESVGDATITRPHEERKLALDLTYISSGTCISEGYYPITSAAACESAAASTGVYS